MSTELLVGGRIYTPASTTATAIAVENGVISWIGEDRAARALHPDAQVTDLDGAFVAPAFVDTHVHLSATGLALTGLDLSGPRDAVVATLQGTLGDAVLARGWDDTTWEAPLLRTDLPADRVIYAARIDEHSAQASTALRALVPDLAGLAGYSPDGPLTAAAHHAVRAAAIAALSDSQITAAQTAALEAAARSGIAAVHENSGPDIAGERDFALLAGIEHPVHVRRYWGEPARDADHAREILARTGADGLAGDLFVDGSLGSHTALLHEPYADADTRGVSYLDDETVANHIAACTEAGIQAGFHAIGDAAMSRIVAGLVAAAERFGGPRVASCTHRIEHAEMVTAEQARLLGDLGVNASMQPLFDAFWGGPDGMYALRLGTDRAAALNDFALLARNAVPLALSSDSPVTPLDPWATVRAATQHHTPGSSISPRAAFAAATRGAWRAGGVRDGVAGTLVPGAPATFAVWDADELVVRAPSDAVQRWSTDPRAGVAPLPDLSPGARLPRCLRTVIDGRTVFAA
ncbi:amidohydrolase [Tsukamurella paurometabola]|uniref:Amidohydrolase 3 n=1 Tax=Tsukamurella paurometabola (strain ATCC 8368 / DSM 20162 / CCUG 35730 / CIP 100753 / JCM 10117 / KCTC 9821 / NBRC 16120 / NCIMB 702349 / NCTC 13040) TaxID=521096 RepID=D5UPQ1_TSUPD|nr:amidohydrolase family protein [Tsukamurella paurometabola]ADG78807.1 Amidohydrolase 3 [Tsukamurella paurometabola DSM 20162]SUP33205.1 imidazolonepropionase [Tsukamurella paurometabola]